MQGRFQITRFGVKNYRSIQNSDVALEPLTFFIGPNASGKTSFVDAMLFVSSALRNSLEKAVTDRGGIYSILHHGVTLPASMQFHFDISSSMGLKSEFHLELRIIEGWSVSIAREECRIENPGGDKHHYVMEDGHVRGSAAVFPAVSTDRIFLSNASGLPEFRLLFEFLANLQWTEPATSSVYHLAQRFNQMSRKLNVQGEDTGFAARFRDLSRSQPERLEIIQQYLRAIAPPFDRVEVIESNGTLWLRFVEKSLSGESMPFYVSQASAGLVNSAEILLELFRLPEEGRPVSALLIEEPEALLHPGAIQVIRDSFIEASRTRQVLVTTHSPDLLDDPSISADWIRIVYRDETGTHIETLDPGTKSVIRDHLYSAGQLLRQGGLSLKP